MPRVIKLRVSQEHHFVLQQRLIDVLHFTLGHRPGVDTQDFRAQRSAGRSNFQVFLPPPLKPNRRNVRVSRESRQVCSLHASHARELPSVRRTPRCRRHIRRNRAPALHQVRHRPPQLFRPIGVSALFAHCVQTPLECREVVNRPLRSGLDEISGRSISGPCCGRSCCIRQNISPRTLDRVT